MTAPVNRRGLLASGIGLTASFLTDSAAAQETPQPRLPWSMFKSTPDAARFLDALNQMQRNTDASDPSSWLFWGNVHQFECPHGRPYFLAWHRGYLALFEAKLRELSGAQLRLPYWDYYTDHEIPEDFKTGGAANPLFMQRQNNSVRGALTTAPFATDVTRFEHGAARSFEALLEGKPHNQVHNLIGRTMATFQSPKDPIFWLHHANIDRLWSAWVGAGHAVPASGHSYWAGAHVYGDGIEISRDLTRETVSLGYRYFNEDIPAPIDDTAPVRPGRAPGQEGQIQSSPNQRSRRPIALDNRSFTVGARIDGAFAANSPERALDLVLDDVRLTEAGADGGFFYEIYANLPDFRDIEAQSAQHLIARLGAFEIATATHVHSGHEGHASGARIVLPAGDVLRGLTDEALGNLNISFVRVSGENAPRGTAIEIGDFSLSPSL